jgi:hypothetical protein
MKQIQIYLTYAEPDTAFATALAERLRSQHAKIWIDQQDAPQDDEAAWRDALLEAMDHADMLLMILSAAAMDYGFLHDDWQFFAQQGRPIVIVVRERLDLPREIKQREPVLVRSMQDETGFNRLQLLLLEHASRLSTDKWRIRPTDE